MTKDTVQVRQRLFHLYYMPKPEEKSPTYQMVIVEILHSAAGPLPAQDLAVQMLSALSRTQREQVYRLATHNLH
ncbi:MAG TPA: hypothetical protein VLH85_08890 [Levilinea sp.]|nr:hypothetical protein [Levilinea sp.]